MSFFRLSEQESEVLGLRVGRAQGRLSDFNIPALEKEILDAGFDICRLKADLADLWLFSSLNGLIFPHEIYTLNYLNRREIPLEPPPMPLGVGYKEFQIGDEDLLQGLLEKISASRSWQEYDSPILNALVPKETEKKLFREFFSSFHSGKMPGAHTFFLYYRDSPAGVFMGLAAGGVFRGALYGILPEFRGMGLSKSIYIAMDHICGMMRLSRFENEIHLLNFASQRSAVSSKLIPQSISANLTLFPLLNLAEQSGESEDLSISDFRFQEKPSDDQDGEWSAKSRIFRNPEGEEYFRRIQYSLPFAKDSEISLEAYRDGRGRFAAIRYLRKVGPG